MLHPTALMSGLNTALMLDKSTQTKGIKPTVPFSNPVYNLEPNTAYSFRAAAAKHKYQFFSYLWRDAKFTTIQTK